MRKLLIIPIIFSFILTGCINIRLAGRNGGVFRSLDKAETWQQKVFVERIKKGKIKTIANANILQMVFHPQDSKIIYLATEEDGAWWSKDGGEKWTNLFTRRGKIKAIAPHPKSRSIIYLARDNKIYKTTDGGSQWTQVYLETKAEQFITYLAVDFYDPKKIYGGISDGRLIRSLDEGRSWKVLEDFASYIRQILINPKNTRIIYVITRKGIFKSSDLGENWQELDGDLKKYSGARDIKIAVFDETKTDALMIASQYGLLKSNDGGRSWQPLKLLSQPGTVRIYSLALNPQNSQEIYYGTAQALYKSTDGGRTWVTKSLPSSRAAYALLVDYDDPKTIYLGVRKLKK